MTKKQRGLGKGLGALISQSQVDNVDLKAAADRGEMRHLPIELIQQGQYQPRKDMHQDALEDLAASIKVQGVMQPIVVRPIAGNKYEIIAGERRWRATQLAGLHDIPALIRHVSDEDTIAMALIENIQRENLNPIEEAVGLQRLQVEFDLTQQEVADAVGKNRATVANLMRLVSLTPEVKTMLEHGDLEMGHARALLGVTEAQQESAARLVVQKGMTVRQTEALVRRLQEPNKPESKKDTKEDPNMRHLLESLGEKLGTPVSIQHNARGKGKLVISYNSLDELDGILRHIK